MSWGGGGACFMSDGGGGACFMSEGGGGPDLSAGLDSGALRKK